MQAVATAPLSHEDNSPPRAAASVVPSYTSTNQSVTQRKVQRCLGMQWNDAMRGAFEYMDSTLPDYLTSREASPSTATSAAAAAAAASPSAATTAPRDQLRVSLERRGVALHRAMLDELRQLHREVQATAAQAEALHGRCARMAAALTPAEQADAAHFLERAVALRAELRAVRQQQDEVREFKERYHFGAEEQKVLEEGPISARYLQVLGQAREAHRRSESRLASGDGQPQTAALVESSFALLNKGLDKVLRYLLSPSTAAAAAASAGGRPGEVNLTADVPEVTPLYLQCVGLLREERPALLLRVVEEVARLRRASVLRRYFHLLTTGSATTSTSVYRGGQSQPSGGGGDDSAGSGGGGQRPLEAELHNPVFFFSSLFAWMHQTMVEESDFLSLFLPPAGVAVEEEGGKSSNNDKKKSMRGRPYYLDFIFSVLVKHMKNALDAVLEKFIKATAADAEGSDGKRGGGSGLKGGLTRLLMAATGRRPFGGGGDGGGGAAGAGGAGGGSDEDSERVYRLQQRYGGVVSRAQLEQAATAAVRPLLQGVQVSFTLLQLFGYYLRATFAPLLETPATSTSSSSNNGKSEWLSFMEDYALLELIKVYQAAVKRLSSHLCDSVIGALPKIAPAERLLQREAGAAAGDVQPPPPQEKEGQAEGKGSLLYFLMQQVLKNHVLTNGHNNLLHHRSSAEASMVLPTSIGNSFSRLGEGKDVGATLSSVSSFSHPPPSTLSGGAGAGGAVATTPNAAQHHRTVAKDSLHVLSTFILPLSPETQACLAVLERFLQETRRHEEVLQAIEQQQQQQQQDKNNNNNSNNSTSAATAESESDLYYTILVQALLSFALTLPQLPAVHHHLGRSLGQLMSYNTYFGLYSVMEPCLHPSASGAAVTDNNNNNNDNHNHHNTRTGSEVILINIVRPIKEKLEELRQALGSAYAAAALDFYFSNLQAPKTVHTTTSDNANTMAEVTKMKDKLKEFYATIATYGFLPTLPLLHSMADVAGRQAIEHQVREALWQRYDSLYTYVREQCPAAQGQQPGQPRQESNEGEENMEEISPHNVKVLLGL